MNHDSYFISLLISKSPILQSSVHQERVPNKKEANFNGWTVMIRPAE